MTEDTPATQVYADEPLAIDADVTDGAASEAECEKSSGGGSDAGSSTSTAASIADVTYSPTVSNPPVPRCGKCGLEVDVVFTKQMKKVNDENATHALKCPKRNTRHVQCVRRFGNWPTPEFNEFDDTEQQKFWREDGTSSIVVEKM